MKTKNFRLPFAIAVLMLAVSCSSEESADFNETNLLGTWDVTKAYLHNLQTGELNATLTPPQRYLYYIINADGTAIMTGTEVTNGSDTATFEATVWNGKNLLILYPGSNADTIEVTTFNPPNMTWNTGIDEVNDNDGDTTYVVFDLVKRQ